MRFIILGMRASLLPQIAHTFVVHIFLPFLQCTKFLHAFCHVKGGAYPRPRTVARVVTTLQLFAAETCNKFLKIEHHDSIVYSKHELVLTFIAGATSDLTAGNTTQEPLDLPARFLQQILLLPYFTM